MLLFSILFFATPGLFPQEVERIPQVNSIYLQSEIARNQFNAICIQSIPNEFAASTESVISLSCSCLKGQLLADESKIQIKMNFGKRIESNQQRIGVILNKKGVFFDWNCNVLADLETDKSIIRINATETDQNETKIRVKTITRNKPVAFCSHCIEFSKMVFQDSRITQLRAHFDKGKKLWLGEYEIQLTRINSSKNAHGTSKITIVNPVFVAELKKAKSKGRVPEWMNYVITEIPVYYSNSKIKNAIVNFGATKIGKSRTREIHFAVVGKNENKRILNQINRKILSSEISLRIDEEGRIQASFSPTKKQRLNSIVEIVLDQKSIGQIHFKGISYGTTK